MLYVVFIFIVFIIGIAASLIPDIIWGKEMEYKPASNYVDGSMTKRLSVLSFILLFIIVLPGLMVTYLMTVIPPTIFDLIMGLILGLWGTQAVKALFELRFRVSFNIAIPVRDVIEYSLHPAMRKVAYARLGLFAFGLLIWLIRLLVHWIAVV